MTFPLPGSFGLFGGEVLLLAVVGSAVWFVGNLLMPRLPAAVVPGPSTAPMPEIHPADVDRITRFELGAANMRGERLDLASEIRWTLSALKPRAAFGLVRLEVAVQPGLALWFDQSACRKLLLDVVGHAIEAAPTGRVLVTAFMHGGRVQIGVSNDSAAVSREAAASALRPADAIAAFHGGSLDVDSRAGQGMTAVIRLPRFTQAPARATVPAPASETAPAPAAAAAADRAVVAAPLETSLLEG